MPDAVIEDVLYAATCAPSAHNCRPGRFALVKDTDLKRRFAHAMGEQLRADRACDGDSPKTIATDAARSIARITGAPLCVLVCLTMEDMDTYPDERGTVAEHQMAVQSTAMAMQLFAFECAGCDERSRAV